MYRRSYIITANQIKIFPEKCGVNITKTCTVFTKWEEKNISIFHSLSLALMGLLLGTELIRNAFECNPYLQMLPNIQV